jgi:transcriptional regulator with XRE-family HTH domain
MSVAQQFSENLLILRRRADLSQEELGFRADLHRTEIGQLERGERLPRIDTLCKLAGALEMTANDLLAGIIWTVTDRNPGHF